MAVLDSATQDVRSSHSHPWLARLVFAVDTMLRRHYAVVEYSSDPACIFRIEIDRADRRVALADGTFLQPGQRVARLHFWNEHIPLLPPKTGAMRWARHVYQSIGTSLHELARYLDGRPDLSDVDVICGDVPSGTELQIGQIVRIMAHYGFEAIPEHAPLPVGERLHRLGENILISMMVFARNPHALRPDTLQRVRVPIYLSRRSLRRKFANTGRTRRGNMAAELPNGR